MSTETTNKKIKIDNGTTFGRTYTDKAVDELLKNVGGGGLNILSLNLKNCMNESDYNELVGYILQKTVIAKTYNITLPDLTGVDIVKFTIEIPTGNIITTFYRNSKELTQFNRLCNWSNDENFMQMVTITGFTDNDVNYIKYNGINSGGSVIELTDKNGTIASAQLGEINANPQNLAFKYNGKILLFTKVDNTSHQYCNNTTNSSDNNVMTTSTLLTIESSTGVYTIAENVHNVVANSIHPVNGGDLTNIQVGSKVYSIPSGGGKPLLDMLPYYDANTQTISQEGLNLLQQKYINNEIVGVSFGAEASCMLLDTMSETGLVFVGPYQVGLGSFKVSINMESRAVVNKWEEKINNLVLPATSPSSQVIPSITTSNEQQNLTIGSGLEIKDGALGIKSNVVKINTYSINIDKTEISTTAEVGILSFAESAKTKNTALFNLLAQNENNILNIKVKLNLVDGTSFLIFMDYHKASAINFENMQGIVLKGTDAIDTHMFCVDDYRSNQNLQEYYGYLSSVDVIVNYY